jgi:muramoyltetrapeptide carboxypeptidase
MVSPPLLQSGDKIGIVATGRRVCGQDIESACDTFVDWGLDVICTPNLYSTDHSYLAGSDAQRMSDLQQLLNSPEIRAIICARGGYGTTRIVDDLDFSALITNPKWIVGFSDVTALHLRLYKLGIKSIHSTMPIFFSRSDSVPSVESLRQTLFAGINTIAAAPNSSNRYGKATGQIIGGNLSLIADAIGTSDDPDTAGKILILEEVDEYSYRIDRMLMHLKRAGKLDNLAGMVIGHMTDIKEPELAFGETIENIVLNKTLQLNYPIAFDFPIGHENPNLAWVHGALMTLDVTASGAQLVRS